MKTSAQVLREAAALVERGWWQSGRGGCGAVAVCALTALGEAAGTDDTAMRAAGLALAATIGLTAATAPEAADALIEWNDAPERTSAEVAAAMRKAAESLEAVS